MRVKSVHICEAMESSIPVVDFSQMSLEKVTEDFSPQSIQHLADEIHLAFSTVGFVYLKNHGIPREKVREFPGKSLKFHPLAVCDKRRLQTWRLASKHCCKML